MNLPIDDVKTPAYSVWHDVFKCNGLLLKIPDTQQLVPMKTIRATILAFMLIIIPL